MAYMECLGYLTFAIIGLFQRPFELHNAFKRPLKLHKAANHQLSLFYPDWTCSNYPLIPYFICNAIVAES